MRKKWGIILGLTGMMLLGSQSIYAAEAADGTAETTDAANEKETAGTDDIESRIKKGGFTAGVSVHDPSVIKDNDTYYIFGSHMESAKSADLRNWIGFSSVANAKQKFWYLTLPLLKPTTIYVVTISVYAGLSMFLESFMLWNGNSSPKNIGLTIVGYLYKRGIEKNDMGYACAVGMVLLVIALAINVVQLVATGTFKKEEK